MDHLETAKQRVLDAYREMLNAIPADPDTAQECARNLANLLDDTETEEELLALIESFVTPLLGDDITAGT